MESQTLLHCCFGQASCSVGTENDPEEEKRRDREGEGCAMKARVIKADIH